jgi:hypothetical protein
MTDVTRNTAESKGQVFAVAVSLSELHGVLMQVARDQYELEVESMDEPLRALTADAACMWLRGLSEVMAYVCELLSGGAITRTDAATVRVAVERFIESAPDFFSETYPGALRADPAVIVADAKVRNALEAIVLPGHREGAMDASRCPRKV